MCYTLFFTKTLHKTHCSSLWGVQITYMLWQWTHWGDNSSTNLFCAGHNWHMLALVHGVCSQELWKTTAKAETNQHCCKYDMSSSTLSKGIGWCCKEMMLAVSRDIGDKQGGRALTNYYSSLYRFKLLGATTTKKLERSNLNGFESSQPVYWTQNKSKQKHTPNI